jgi:heptosyltransferase-2
VGDLVMATPALALLRRSFPGIFIGGLVRPGLDELLAGTAFFDEIHLARASGVMGPKHAAGKIRPRRYDTALLLTNSFSTALTTRLAGIPRRIGYDRDLRGILLTDKLRAPIRTDGSWAPVPAVNYYLRLVRECVLGRDAQVASDAAPLLELGVTPEQEGAGREILTRAHLLHHAPYAILNPGGNNENKRWPADRFAALADHLATRHGLAILANGSPSEAKLIDSIVRGSTARVVSLPALGITLGSLKEVVRGSRILVTNDTGPRHIAGAFGVPLVSLFGPTDSRWTAIPTRSSGPEAMLLADPSLPKSELANDHPVRCRIDRIELERVCAACDALLKAPA